MVPLRQTKDKANEPKELNNEKQSWVIKPMYESSCPLLFHPQREHSSLFQVEPHEKPRSMEKDIVHRQESTSATMRKTTCTTIGVSATIGCPKQSRANIPRSVEPFAGKV